MTDNDGLDRVVSAREFHESDGTGDWRVVGDGACAFFPTGSLAASARLVAAIAAVPGAEDHRPDLDVRPDGVTVRLLTAGDEWYGLSARDLDLARRISAAARELGVPADPAVVQSLLLVVGVHDVPASMAFWRAILGYEVRPDSPQEDLVDPRLRTPAIWFEALDEPAAPHHGGIHAAVWVPPDQAEARVAAALAAGGRMVRDVAPMWWTLADPEGNEVDVSSVRGRD